MNVYVVCIGNGGSREPLAAFTSLNLARRWCNEQWVVTPKHLWGNWHKAIAADGTEVWIRRLKVRGAK